jgi:hypothetical protein
MEIVGSGRVLHGHNARIQKGRGAAEIIQTLRCGFSDSVLTPLCEQLSFTLEGCVDDKGLMCTGTCLSVLQATQS